MSAPRRAPQSARREEKIEWGPWAAKPQNVNELAENHDGIDPAPGTYSEDVSANFGL